MGEVKIAADVVAAIAGLAANEVEGVHSMVGNLTNELIGRLGVKMTPKGVRVFMEDSVVRVDIVFNMKYGYSIPEVSRQIQDKVSQQIETMTGLVVPEVNVRVAGVYLAD
ncbi:MAG: Asp23/Gls24 family envelope stress response protein [Clostridiaceae bacterium]|nr:Asp23/Gls24 family envelope stress response protein [Clostridiaceae bacterium]